MISFGRRMQEGKNMLAIMNHSWQWRGESITIEPMLAILYQSLKFLLV